MLDRLSPLAHEVKPGIHGASSDVPVVLGQRPILSLWQIAGWSDFEKAAQKALADSGLTNLGDFRTAQKGEATTAYRIAPDRLLIEGAPDLTCHATDDLVALDLSHARCVITLEGPQARTVLSQLTGVDVSERQFRPGHFVQTGMHHIGVLLSCVAGDRFDLIVPSTWAATLWDALCVNATPFGYEVREDSSKETT